MTGRTVTDGTFAASLAAHSVNVPSVPLMPRVSPCDAPSVPVVPCASLRKRLE